MARLKTEEAYNAAMQRIEELLKVVTDETPTTDSNYQELDILSDMVAEYEDLHYTFGKAELSDVIKLRMYERSLSQEAVARLLGISASRLSELLHGKTEPSYRLSRELCLKLDIEPAVVLGLQHSPSHDTPIRNYLAFITVPSNTEKPENLQTLFGLFRSFR